MIDFINFHLVPGLLLGSIYALGAIGVSLIFGILRFANFAHGEMMTLSAYFTFSLFVLLGVHPLFLLPLVMILMGCVSLFLDRYIFRPIRLRKTVVMVIASFGLMLMLRSLIQLFWGTELRTIRSGIELPWIFFDTIRIAPRHLLIISLSLLFSYLVHLLLTRTKIGKAMRAVSDDQELARVTGIDSEMVIKVTWFVGASLAASAGVFLAYDTQITTMLGFHVLLPIFASAILGGIGSPYGAFAGGLTIGMMEEISSYHFWGDSSLLDPSYKTGVSFVVMVIVLVFRPQGIFSGRQF